MQIVGRPHDPIRVKESLRRTMSLVRSNETFSWLCRTSMIQLFIIDIWSIVGSQAALRSFTRMGLSVSGKSIRWPLHRALRTVPLDSRAD